MDNIEYYTENLGAETFIKQCALCKTIFTYTREATFLKRGFVNEVDPNEEGWLTTCPQCGAIAFATFVKVNELLKISAD